MVKAQGLARSSQPTAIAFSSAPCSARPAAASSQVAPVAASDLASSSIEDDVPDRSRSRVAIDRRLFEHRTSMLERLNHLVSVDDFHVKKPIELAEILDGEVHALSW